MTDQTERSSFYDEQYSTFMNYVLNGVHTRYRGIELGLAYKITPPSPSAPPEPSPATSMSTTRWAHAHTRTDCAKT